LLSWRSTATRSGWPLGRPTELLAKGRDAGKIVMAGSFPDESGALLIFNVGSEAELDELMDADPFDTTAGVHVARR